MSQTYIRFSFMSSLQNATVNGVCSAALGGPCFNFLWKKTVSWHTMLVPYGSSKLLFLINSPFPRGGTTLSSVSPSPGVQSQVSHPSG